MAAAPDDADFVEDAADLHNRAVERLVRLAQDGRVRGGRAWQDVFAELGVGLVGASDFLEPRRFRDLVPARFRRV